jgi:hypothetical protein
MGAMTVPSKKRRNQVAYPPALLQWRAFRWRTPICTDFVLAENIHHHGPPAVELFLQVEDIPSLGDFRAQYLGAALPENILLTATLLLFLAYNYKFVSNGWRLAP